MTLPKIISFVWCGSVMPDWARRNIDEFRRLNPDHDIRIHGEEVLLPELQSAFDQAQGWSSKSDPLRYSALKRFGGWYFDVDFWPLRPLDDAVRAWEIDGQRMFISKQQGHSAGDRLPFNAAACAAATDSPGLDLLISMCVARKAESRCSYGPILVKEAVERSPEKFLVSEAGWWYPIAIHQAKQAYPLLMRDPSRLAIRNAGTLGQLPFGAHLWAEAVDLAAAFRNVAENRPLAIVQSAGRDSHPLHAVAAGLEASGFHVIRADHGDEVRHGIIRPAVVVAWNGIRDPEWRKSADAMQAPCMFMEHGFFSRKEYTQLDHAGFLHNSSWTTDLRQPAPADGAERLARFYPDGVVPVCAREEGYALVLGQVTGDTQMIDSEITGSPQLERYIAANLPKAAKAYFRPHPQLIEQAASRVHRSLPRLPAGEERHEYVTKKHGSGLANAMQGAQFVVAINSNGLNEALAAGIPCLAFGPFLGIQAGVVHPTSLRTLKHDLNEMFNGWAPNPERVVAYLQHLACRQYSNDELSSARCLAPLLAAAGVAPIADQVPA